MTNDFENNAPDTVIVDGVKNELNEIDTTDVSEHAARYETMHQKLQETLSGIGGL